MKTKVLAQKFVVTTVLLQSINVAVSQCGPGPALSFNGTNAFVRIPGFGTNAPRTEVTVEFWQKVSSVKNQSTFSLTSFNATNVFNAHVPYGNGVVYWDFGNINTSGRLSYTPSNSLVGAWQHFALVASQSANYMAIYRNGIMEAFKTGMTPFAGGTLDLAIGGAANLGVSFGGIIDEFRIWSVARSQAEIQNNMNRSLTVPQANLMAYWRFDEGTGDSAFDSSGQNRTGTLVNNPTWVSSDYPYVPGVVTEPSDAGSNGIVTFKGTVNPNGLPTTAWFQWGPTTNYGSNTFSINIGSGTSDVAVQATVSNLLAGNSYHYSIVANNPVGTAAGADRLLTLPALTQEYVPERFGVINIIPANRSDEIAQNSEPSFCFGLNRRNFEVVAHTFPANPNPYYISSAFISNWSEGGSLSDRDATMDWGAAGACYMATIPALTQISVLQSTDPVAGVPFSTIASSTITRGSWPSIPDQPRVRVVNVNNVDHIFVGFNDLTASEGKTATIRYSMDGGSSWKESVLERRSPGAGQDSPAVPIAISPDGQTVYALFLRWTSSNDEDFVGDVVLVRDDQSGDGGFGALGEGTLVAHDVVLPWGTTLGAQRLGSACDVALDPSDPSVVYVAYTAVVEGEPTHVRLLRSRDSGAHFTLVSEIYGSLPALAVATDGTVGMLSAYRGWNLTDLGIAFTKYLGGSFASQDRTTQILAKFPNNQPVKAWDPYVGDYFGLRAFNNNFYGVFCASGEPNVDHFPSGVYFQRNVRLPNGTIQNNSILTVSGTLVNAAGGAVKPSIDPYFFYDIAPYFRTVPQLSLVKASVLDASDPLSGVTHLRWGALTASESQFELMSSPTLGPGATWTQATCNTILQTNGQFFATLLCGPTQQFYRLQRNMSGSQFRLLASAGPNGSLAPTGVLTNSFLENRTFTATPGNHYAVSQWYLDGSLVQTSGTSLTVSNIASEHIVSVTFAASNDLAVSVFEVPAEEGPTLTLTTSKYVINIENKGLNALSSIVMSNFLPATVSLVSATNNRGTVSFTTGIVNAYVDALAPGEGATVEILFLPSMAGLITNNVVVTCSESEPDLFNNTAADVTAVIDPVTITNQPASQSVPAGSTVNFSVGVSGTPPFTYEWFFNGTNLLSSGSNSTLTLTNVTPAQAGSYSVIALQVLGPENIQGANSTNAVLSVQ